MEVHTMTIFEKIIQRELPAHIVYEDDLAIAFLDISQISKGHTLVVPKKSYPNLLSMPDDLLQHLIVVAKKVAHAIEKTFKPKGFNLLNNNGEIAGQTVFHFHIHVVPRYSKDELHYQVHPRKEKDDLKLIAEVISSAL